MTLIKRLRRLKWMVNDEMRGLVQDTTAHEAADVIEAQEVELLRIRKALDTICVQSNPDWEEVQANPAGKIKLIHTTAVAARFWREGDD